ncbi:hypothetical protein ANCDUO_19138, partial [Ancylostoma duodenale]
MPLSTTSTKNTIGLFNIFATAQGEADGSRATKRRLSYESLKLIRQRGVARAAGNYQLTSELANRCREVIKEDLKERRAAVLAEAAEAGQSIRNARRDFSNRKTKMTALRRPD